MRLTLDEIAKNLTPARAGSAATGGVGAGNLQRDGLAIGSVCTDSRALQDGDLFVALRGERFDGNDFVLRAFEAGAVAAVVERIPDGLAPEQAGRCLVVQHTLAAYGVIARLWRSKLDIPVVGVTGSVGKTTTKEMIALALSSLGPVLRSAGNENNEIGVPQTLLRLDETHRAAVIEMGMRAHGEIAYLAGIARPTIGVITAIGESHIELLGSREAIADAKGELFEALPEDGYAVMSRDDDYFAHIRVKTLARLVVTSMQHPVGLHAIESEQVGGMWRFTAVAPDAERVRLALRSPARHDIANALSALAAAMAAGVPLESAARALEGYTPHAMRMESFTTAAGAVVLNDSYNASPTSMKSAIETLAAYPASGRKIAFLGDMKELGEHAGAMHREVARAARDLGIREIYTVGDMMREAFAGELRGEHGEPLHFADSREAADYAARRLDLHTGDVVLTKGSRAMAMELVAEALRRQ